VICPYCHQEHIPATSATTGCCEGERRSKGWHRLTRAWKSENYQTLWQELEKLRMLTEMLDDAIKHQPMAPVGLSQQHRDGFLSLTQAMLRCQ
jgi:hypothetical protein